jgi:hypothetical protein
MSGVREVRILRALLEKKGHPQSPRRSSERDAAGTVADGLPGGGRVPVGGVRAASSPAPHLLLGMTHDQQWLIERHGSRTPIEARQHLRARLSKHGQLVHRWRVGV